jgi:DNA-directed RNA polymerase specialized sigma24 family protein
MSCRWCDSCSLPSSTQDAIDLLSDLTPDDRAIVALRYWYGFQAVEIAAITERTPEAVRKRLERCRTALAQRLEISEQER